MTTVPVDIAAVVVTFNSQQHIANLLDSIPAAMLHARGVRNPQGLTWDPASGQAFAADHGPSGFPNERFRRDRDELNVMTLGGGRCPTSQCS